MIVEANRSIDGQKLGKIVILVETSFTQHIVNVAPIT